MGPFFLLDLKMKKFIFLLLVSATFSVSADQIKDGRAKSDAACVLCHGAIGQSAIPNVPHIAGQPSVYISEQLKNYRNGKRQNEVMNLIAKQLTDVEIVNLAAWFESVKLTFEAP